MNLPVRADLEAAEKTRSIIADAQDCLSHHLAAQARMWDTARHASAQYALLERESARFLGERHSQEDRHAL